LKRWIRIEAAESCFKRNLVCGLAILPASIGQSIFFRPLQQLKMILHKTSDAARAILERV
jgi:hypothetical protein